jgi:hypothetical protein
MSKDPLPDHFDANGIAAALTVIVAPILHEVDGKATAEVWLAEPPSSLVCVYDSLLEIPSGQLTVSDASMSETVAIHIPGSSHRARLCVDGPGHAELVALYLTPSD